MIDQPAPVDPAVASVMEVLGCQRWVPAVAPPQCWTHLGDHVAAPWTDRGCPLAVAAADAAAPHIAAQTLRDFADELDRIYPPSIFTPTTTEGTRRDNRLLREAGSSVDKYSAAGARNAGVLARDRAARIEAGDHP